MIEPRVFSQTYANLSILETCGQNRKVTSEQVQEIDAILQDDGFSLEEKTLT